MKSKTKSKVIEELEKMVNSNHVHHYPKDPVEGISNYVIAVIFLSVFILFMVFAFMQALDREGPDAIQTFALVKFDSMGGEWFGGLSSGLSDFVTAVRNSADRPLILLSFYTLWIIVVGIANLVHFEQKRRK